MAPGALGAGQEGKRADSAAMVLRLLTACAEKELSELPWAAVRHKRGQVVAAVAGDASQEGGVKAVALGLACAEARGGWCGGRGNAAALRGCV